MALTPLVPEGGAGWLSKEKIGSSIYYIKDLPLREMLNDAATKVAATAINDDNKNSDAYVPTNKAILAYLEDAIQGLTGAMHFAGVVEPQGTETPVEALERALPDAESGDIAIVGNKEFVFDGTNWKELGDEGIYATEADLQALEIAGVPLGSDHNITAAELKTALGLGSFAYANSGTGSIRTVDTASVSIPASTLTLSGTAVSVPQTFSALDVTPAGDVAITAGTAAAASYKHTKSGSVQTIDSAKYDKVNADVAISAAAPQSGETANYTPAGTITLPSFSASLNLAESAVATVTDNGTAYALSGGSVSQAADTTSAFATEGVTAAMDTTDTEMLVFSVAGTTNAVTASGAVTYTGPTLTGSLPTFGSKDVVIKTGSSATASADGDASFSGSAVLIKGAASTSQADVAVTRAAAAVTLEDEDLNATMTQPTFSAAFTGTEKTVTPAAATTAEAAPMAATAAVAAQTVDVDLVSTNKTVTVNPVQA